MKWFQKLFGTEAGATGPDAMAADEQDLRDWRVTIEPFGRQIVVVPEINFIGRCAASPDGRYHLLWRDHFFLDDAHRSGRYVLIHDGRVVLDERMERPHDGKVADNGVFILLEQGDDDRLWGAFHAFAPDGRVLLSREFDARLFNNGLSNDGTLAVCQACNAPASADSSALCVFDLANGREIARWQHRAEWADAYEFAGDGLRMMRRERVIGDYTLSGVRVGRREAALS